jgi:rhomboid protease GluP
VALIAVTAVATAVGLIFSHEGFPLGAKFGLGIADGEWWRLATTFFVHYSTGHFTLNMMALWFFGWRLERVLGHWTFLALYLACGVTGSVASVIANPEQPGAGASGAVFGVCAGLFVHYALRLRTLSRKQRIKLVALGMCICLAFWSGFTDLHIDAPCHAGGVAAGVILGCVLSLPFGRPALIRSLAFAATGIVLAIAAFEFRQRNFYLVHLNAAVRAIQSGNVDLAEEELQTAHKMKPDSPIGQFLQQKLDEAAR